ncbi:Aldo-keto reductase family 1 member C18 [Portunus trituberculatus]|uniref:Aldo-keto reductase family 1 member C18 n=1 Tax=Portunus trituberculatus TaxID=210409 RepID=A0A5B7IZG2_PORTR|nr:Aldo-keto reductase family 1 member C18 [Portunus trituberculatus]
MIGNREKDVSKFLQKSLNMLGLTYVDLYLIHCPVGFIGKDDNDIKPKDEEGNTVLDFETNLEGIWRGMEAQVYMILNRSGSLLLSFFFFFFFYP